MDIFISWSGTKSHDVAKILQKWISCVIQASNPWLSSDNIDAGSIWFNEIQNQLSGTSFGVICLTKENKDKPWILFEAGALAKGMSTNKVAVLLCDLTPSDIQPPLSQFNCISPTEEGMRKLFRSINSHIPSESLRQDVLETAFQVYWDKFSEDLHDITSRKDTTPDKPTRPDSDILSEILSLTRSLANRVSHIEEHNKIINKKEGTFLRSNNKKEIINKNALSPEIQKKIDSQVEEFAYKAFKKFSLDAFDGQ